MTKSYPWPGIAPGQGDDAGNYTAPEWWAIWMAMQNAAGVVLTGATPLRTSTTRANIGVY